MIAGRRRRRGARRGSTCGALQRGPSARAQPAAHRRRCVCVRACTCVGVCVRACACVCVCMRASTACCTSTEVRVRACVSGLRRALPPVAGRLTRRCIARARTCSRRSEQVNRVSADAARQVSQGLLASTSTASEPTADGIAGAAPLYCMPNPSTDRRADGITCRTSTSPSRSLVVPPAATPTPTSTSTSSVNAFGHLRRRPPA